jgi:hypothetical protein
MTQSNTIVIEKKDSGYIGQDIREPDEMWCLHCNEVFPAKQLKVDSLGNRQGCGSRKYPDCDGAGLSVDIYMADDPFAAGSREDSLAEKARYAAMTEQEKREEHIEWSFRSDFDHHSQKTYLNKSHTDWSSEEVYGHVCRWNEMTELQCTIDEEPVSIKRLISLNAPDYLIEERTNRLSEWTTDLESLLRSEPHRSSIRFVMVKLLDKKELEEHRVSEGGRHHEYLFTLLESLSQNYIRAGVPVPTHLVMPEKSFRRSRRKRK